MIHSIYTPRYYAAWRAVACAALLLAAAACSNELDQPAAPDTTAPGQKVTLTANLGSNDPQTRISFDDPETGEVKLTWSKGDQFIARSDYKDGAATIKLFTLTGDGGSTSGSFTGESPVASGEWISFFYPSASLSLDSDKVPMATTFGQTQTGNGSTAHLSDYHFMVGGTDDLTQPITFYPGSTLMRFDATLEGYDATSDGAPVKLTLAYANPFGQDEYGFNHAVRIDNNASSCGQPGFTDLLLKDVTLDTDNKLRAYLMLINGGRITVKSNNHLVISVTCANGTVYRYDAPAPDTKKEYDRGMRYRTTCTLTKVAADPGTVFDNSTVASASFTGGGTSAADPYLISSAADLKKLADAGLTYENKFFKLTKDICVKKSSWTPIGRVLSPFRGTFDGDGHTISGQLIGDQECFGFFGVITEGAVVKNLHVTAKVTNNSTQQTQRTGAVVGSISFPGNGGTVGTITNCTNSGAVTVTQKKGYNLMLSHTGGIVGAIDYGNITNCINRGKVTGQFAYANSSRPATGGVIGNISYNCIVTNCTNYGEVTANENGADKTFHKGGIVGSGDIGGTTGGLTSCTNFGTVTKVGADVYGNSGGLIGFIYCQMEIATVFTLHNCINRGLVEVTTSNVLRKDGGLIGNIQPLYPQKLTFFIGKCCADMRSEQPALIGQLGINIWSLNNCTEGHIERTNSKPINIR